MAFLSSRKSRGHKYWSIVESRRVNGKPRNFILEYLGTAEKLLQKLNNKESMIIKSYSHGDTSALINIAKELNIISIINKHTFNNSKKPKSRNISVGASLLLASIGRACRPTSKMGWYDWCKNTSLEYCLKSSFKNLTSQHFWNQMNLVKLESIPLIERDIVKELIKKYDIKLDCLLFDTTNFFTFIDSTNKHCDLPQRGKNKQKRGDLRQLGMALLASRKNQFPLFHKTYKGNNNDITVFQEVFSEFVDRIKSIYNKLLDVTFIFDKGNNSKKNFKKLDNENDLYYVGGLVPSYFKDLIKAANNNFQMITVDGENIPAFRTKQKVWEEERTCIVTISEQLKEGQIRGINQGLNKRYKKLENLKKQLENPKTRTKLSKEDLEERLDKIIKGQFIKGILQYKIIELKNDKYSFTYNLNQELFDKLKSEILGRQILVTNRHEWSNKEIILAYRGQAKVEYAFRNLKNPFHMAVRPQYHWTDQKIEVHILICIIGYLLSVAAYTKVKKNCNYKKNINAFMNDLKTIRLAVCTIEGKEKIKYQLEEMTSEIKNIAKLLEVTNENIRPNINISGYI